MFSKAQDVADKYREAEKQFAFQGRAAINEMIQEFLERFPNVYALQWNQYTPYFNDGDPCTFRLGELDVRLTQEGMNFYGLTVDQFDDDDDRDGDVFNIVKSYRVHAWSLGHTYVEGKKLFVREENEKLFYSIQAFDSVANQLQKAFLVAYGDGVEVIAGRNFLETDEYDPD